MGFAAQIRALGAIAHFDPSYGATDDGTTSTWVDRIGGYSVASTSAGTRMTYSSSIAGLNNMPGWTGVAASSTKLTGASGLASTLGGSTAYTMYTVSISTNLTSSNAIAGIGSTTLDSYVFSRHLASTGGIDYARSLTGGATVNTGVVLNGTSACVTSLVFTGTTASVWANGSPDVVTGANTRAPVCDRFIVGAALTTGTYTQFLNGSLGDIIIFTGTHSDATRMFVERLIASKYGWPVLQGLSGFSNANYLANASTTSGIRGDNTNGIWSDVLVRADVLPSLNPANIAGAYGSNTGYGFISAVTSVTPTAYNGTTGAAGPAYTQLAADVGKLQLWGIAAGPANLVRTFRQGAEVGSGTALAGFSKNSNTAYSIGARGAANPASQYTIFGVAGGNSAQVAADAANRAAAIKSASAFVTSGGVAATHGWKLDSVASTYSDLVGSDAMTLTGTLTAAQIIVPTWPW